MKDDVFGLDLPVLDVNLVPTQDDGYVITHPYQVPVPVGHILVCDPRCHVKHDDGTLALDVVAVAESSELLLSCSVPHIEPDGSSACVEHQRVDLHTQRRCKRERLVLLTIQRDTHRHISSRTLLSSVS